MLIIDMLTSAADTRRHCAFSPTQPLMPFRHMPPPLSYALLDAPLIYAIISIICR